MKFMQLVSKANFESNYDSNFSSSKSSLPFLSFFHMHKTFFYTKHFLTITTDQTFGHAKCIKRHSESSQALEHLIGTRRALGNLRHSGTRSLTPLKYLSTQCTQPLGNCTDALRILGNWGTQSSWAFGYSKHFIS